MSKTKMNNLWSSLLANAILAIAYSAYKVIDRCQRSKCAYTNQGLEFDLGEPADCPAQDMSKLADLIKARSQHHLTKV